MTNEEAINVLEDYDINFERHTAEAIAEAHEMAIKALEQQPSERTEERTETHECDCISRQAVLEITAETGALETQTRVKTLPSVTPQPKEEPQQKTEGARGDIPLQQSVPKMPQQKIGHWTHDGSSWKNRWICSECGYKLYDEQSKYCPDCGIKMQEAKE